MHTKPIALVTGANKGIGLQIAKDLISHGFIVLLGSRNLEQGETAAKSIGDNASALQLDVTSQTSIAAAAERVRNEFGRLDVLVNNAAISHAGKQGRPLNEVGQTGRISVVPVDELRTVFETNVFGVVAVTQSLLSLLREAPSARIVNVSSGAGSLTAHAKPDHPGRPMFGTYSSSKTALNAITLALSIDLESTGIKVNAVCPGFTATGLNNFEGTQTVEQAAREPVRLALLDEHGPSGGFSSHNGSMPW